MKGVIMEREEGHGKGLLLRGAEVLSESRCEIMFPLCNVEECKARLLTSKLRKLKTGLKISVWECGG